MKKITLLHYAYPPSVGGVEHLMQEHAVLLADSGYSVNILTGEGHEKDSRISLTVVPEFRSLHQYNPKLHQKLVAGEGGKEAEELIATMVNILETSLVDTDVVILHNMLTVYRNIPFIEAFYQYCEKHPDKKIIVWIHDHMFVGLEKPQDAWKSESSFIQQLLTRINSQFTYVVISESFKKLLQEVMPLPEDRTHVIPGGIDTKRFLLIDPQVWKYFKMEGVIDSFPVLLAPANIVERKNLEYAFEVVKELKPYYPQVKLVITGNPSKHKNTLSYYDTLKNIALQNDIKENILFLTESPAEVREKVHIQDLYHLSDGVLYYSKSENFGLPLLEGGIARLPLFTSQLPVFQEVAGDKLYSSDIESDSPRDAALKISSYFKNQSNSSWRSDVIKNYDLESLIKEKLIPLLESER